MTEHGHFARGPDPRLQPLDLPASRSPGLQRASDRPNRWRPFPCGLLGIRRRQPHNGGHRQLRRPQRLHRVVRHRRRADAAQLGIRDRHRCPDVPDPATPQQGHSCGLPGHADLRGRRPGHRCREPHRRRRLRGRHPRELRILQHRRGRARYRKPLLLRSALPHRTRSAFPSCLGFHRLRVLRRGQPAGAVRRRGRRARQLHPRWIVRADVRHLADRQGILLCPRARALQCGRPGGGGLSNSRAAHARSNEPFIFLAERRRTTMTNIDLRPVARDDRTAPHLGPSREAWWTVRRAGVVAGVALLVMVALAAFANFVVVQGMLTPGDGPATAAEIVAREGTFRLGVLAWLLIVVLDIVIAWALYRVFRPVSPAVSMLAAVFRLVYAAVLLVAVGQLLRAVDVLTANSTLTASGADGVGGRALLELNAFQDLYDLGLFLFGIHLALLGYLSLRSDFIPKVVGALLVVAGAGYAFDTVGAVLGLELPRVSAFTFLGELLLALWLLVAGRRLRAVDSAPAMEVRHAL